MGGPETVAIDHPESSTSSGSTHPSTSRQKHNEKQNGLTGSSSVIDHNLQKSSEMSKRKKVEMAARRVACDEIPDKEFPVCIHLARKILKDHFLGLATKLLKIGSFISSSDGSTPVPTMDDNRWETLINEERPFNADMPRDTIPQALKELMSERLVSGTIDKVCEMSNMINS